MASLVSSRLAVRALGRYRSAVSGLRNSVKVQPTLQSKCFAPAALVSSNQLCFQNSLQSRQFTVSSVLNADRKFTKEHEWVAMDGNIGTVGITQYAQEALGDVVYVSLPDVGTKFFEGDEFGTIESVKAANELFCPLSGDISEVNEVLHDKPELVNESCYEKGWLIKIKVKNPDTVDALMSEQEYDTFLKSMA